MLTVGSNNPFQAPSTIFEPNGDNFFGIIEGSNTLG